jgi:hypothetical protein
MRPSLPSPMPVTAHLAAAVEAMNARLHHLVCHDSRAANGRARQFRAARGSTDGGIWVAAEKCLPE